MPKIKIFLWQMCHNTLPVRGTLFRRGYRIEPHCPLCTNDIESTEHLFQECPQSKTVWDLAQQRNWIPSQATINQATPWLSNFETFLTSYERKTLQRISFLLWSIWKMRNAVIFQQDFVHPIKCLIQAKKTMC